jgi:hypothetical protein
MEVTSRTVLEVQVAKRRSATEQLAAQQIPEDGEVISGNTA